MKVIVSKSVKEMAAFIGEAASKIGIYPAYCLQGCGEVKEHCFLVPKSDAQKELFIKKSRQRRNKLFCDYRFRWSC